MSRLEIPLKLDFNDQFAKAFHVMENTGKNVFVTGKAGTGKSTLLQYFRNNTRKNIVILAPTGVAAVNIKGQTIHSFFNFKPDVTPDNVGSIKPRNKKIYKNIDAVVIDEISMVRADLLDCIDIFLRKFGKKKKLQFGGAQMIFIGDLYQLPPVVTYREKDIFKSHYKSPYFFDAKAFNSSQFTVSPSRGDRKEHSSREQQCQGLAIPESPFDMAFLELEKVYRQTDEHFIGLLNKIRNNTVDADDLAELNKRCTPDFRETDRDFYIHLTTTNDLADAVNHEKLINIKGREYRYNGLVEGNFQAKDLPTHQSLTLKKSAQVMLLNNQQEGLWINGSIGKIIDIEKDDAGRDVIGVELSDGGIVYVTPFTWEMFRFHFDEKNKIMESESIGSFTQYPLKLAWAVTIHKSQGKTFDKVIIDIGRGTFSHGQMYVALSRCTTLEGIVLKKPLEKKHIMMDWRVVNFVTRYQYNQADRQCSVNDKICIIREAIKDSAPLEIVYLKAKDEKSRRTIMPNYVGELEYNGVKYLGMKAFCTQRKDERTFRVDRILEILSAGE